MKKPIKSEQIIDASIDRRAIEQQRPNIYGPGKVGGACQVNGQGNAQAPQPIKNRAKLK